MNTILASKIKMGQMFENGVRYPVTRVVAGPCVVTQIKNEEKDGYWAVQLGFGKKKIKNTTKPMQGHLKSVSKDNIFPRYLREVRFKEKPTLEVGNEIKVSDIFSVGDTISVTGVSKGKGFAGGVKRWGFSGGPKTHGQSDRQRAPGSIGQGTTPGRVYKGKHMAGHMGVETVTMKNLKVVAVDDSKNELSISSPVPGPSGSLLIIKRLSDKQEVAVTQEVVAPIEEKIEQEVVVKDEKKEETNA